MTEKTDGYRQCSVSVLDTDDDPHIRFDAEGRSHYYHEYMAVARERLRHGDDGRATLNKLAERIRSEGAGKRYDCIVGLSGGADSTYVAYLAKQLSLRPLTVHLDNGWDSEAAVKNIQNAIERLGFDLYTYVIDWQEFRDLQLAYLKASVVDIEVVTDHAILATLYRLCAQHGIRHILSGTNVVTEQVMPPHWVYAKTDHVNIKAIHRAFGTVPLKTYPFVDLRVKKYYQTVKGIESHSVLDYVDYDAKAVKELIGRELGWKDYGGKHYESVFTRFYQGYILPTKFGIDKRKAHLSNLIFAGQKSRAEALVELEGPTYPAALRESDYEFVVKKLGISKAEFEEIMSRPARSHREFAFERPIYDRYPLLNPLRGPVGAIMSYFASRK